MDKSFHVFDFHRIFIGDAPLIFLLEIIFRTTIMYLYTVFLLRLLGKRGMGQLSTLELAIIIGFGSAVGDPMMAADVPIFHGLTAVTVITLLQIGLERLVNKNKKVEVLMEGSANCIVEDGIIKWDCMKNDNLSKEDLFRSLRGKDVEHLGEVSKAFFETSGQISVMFQPPKRVKHGLSILPENEIKEWELNKAPATASQTNFYSCFNCGYTKEVKAGEYLSTCNMCDGDTWLLSKS